MWSADLVDMSQLSKLNNGYKYLLMVIDVFSKYGCIVPLKSQTGREVVDVFATATMLPTIYGWIRAVNSTSNSFCEC